MEFEYAVIDMIGMSIDIIQNNPSLLFFGVRLRIRIGFLLIQHVKQLAIPVIPYFLDHIRTEMLAYSTVSLESR
jgi:hypothetical protein